MKPRVDIQGAVKCGQCLSPLTPIVGEALDREGRWLWWACSEGCGAITESLPLPPMLITDFGVTRT